MVFLETERLILRNVEPPDAQIMFDYRNNEICARYQRGQTKDMEGLRSLIERHFSDVISVEGSFILAAALKTTGEMIGEIVVMPNEGTISIGYTFSYRHHRKGYATEVLSAFIDLLHKRFPSWDFVCFTDPNNIPSMKLLKKLGYRDLGYVSSKESQVFGKWLNPDTETEIAEAVKE